MTGNDLHRAVPIVFDGLDLDLPATHSDGDMRDSMEILSYVLINFSTCSVAYLTYRHAGTTAIDAVRGDGDEHRCLSQQQFRREDSVGWKPATTGSIQEIRGVDCYCSGTVFFVAQLDLKQKCTSNGDLAWTGEVAKYNVREDERAWIP